MGRNKHLTSSHWVGPIIICSFGAHQPSLISHTAPRWPSLSNSARFSFNYDSADLKKYCSLLSKTLNCHSPKDWFLTGNKCPEEMVLCPHRELRLRVRFCQLSSVSLLWVKFLFLTPCLWQLTAVGKCPESFSLRKLWVCLQKKFLVTWLSSEFTKLIIYWKLRNIFQSFK